MKKYILLLSYVILSTVLPAQDVIKNSTELPYDLLDTAGKFPEDFYIRDKMRVRYKINNINRNVYTVTVNSELISQFADKPTIFNLLSEPDISKLKTAGDTAAFLAQPLEQLNSSLSADKQLVVAKYITARLDVEDLLDSVQLNYINLKKVNRYYKELVSILNNGTDAFTKLQAAKLSSGNALLTELGYAGPALDEASLRTSLRAFIGMLFERLEKNYNDLIRKHGALKAGLLSIENMATEKNKELNEEIKTLEKQMAGMKNKNERQKKETAINSKKDKIKTISAELQQEKLKADVITEIIAEMKLIYQKVSEMEKANFEQEVLTAYQRINEQSWMYISPSLKSGKDEMLVKINIQPKDGTLFSPNYNKFNGEYTGYVYGFKINFSTGFFVVGGKNVFDKKYKIDTIPNDANNNIITEINDKQSILPAAGALMHFYWKQAKAFNWGGAFGLSISTQTKLNYHGGLSLIFGEQQRIILSGGTTLTQAKRISDPSTLNQKIAKSSNVTSIPTENQSAWGYFISFTYNLSK